jgi:hypothetical protein
MTLDAVRKRIAYVIRKELHLGADVAAKRTDQYLKFMELKVKHHDLTSDQLAPSSAIHLIWHNHILDTQSYQQLQSKLMPGGGFILHNAVHADQPNYEARHANTLSLILQQYGVIDSDSWPTESSEYKKLNLVVTRADDSNASAAGPQVYCHKKQTVSHLIETIRLVLGYTADDRVIVSSSMDMNDAPKYTQQVSKTTLWTSAIVRVTTFSASGSDNDVNCKSITGDNRLRYLQFQDKDAECEVSCMT